MPGALAVLMPVLIGVTFRHLSTKFHLKSSTDLPASMAGLVNLSGAEAVASFLMVGTISGILLAMLMNAGTARTPAIFLSVILVLWMARCVRTIFFAGEINVGRIVSGLLAGIVFVDWLAVAPQISPTLSTVVFLALFGAAQLLQRFVPAT